MAHSGNGGLQAHSIGPIYPWTIVVTGTTILAMHCETGIKKGGFVYTPGIEGSFQRAHDHAERSAQAEIDKEIIGTVDFYEYSYDSGYFRRHKVTGKIDKWNAKVDGSAWSPLLDYNDVPDEWTQKQAA